MLEGIKMDFNKLRYKFPEKEIDKYRKGFYDIKNYKHLSTPEIKEAGKILTELKKGLKSFMVILIVLIMILINMMIIMILQMMMNTEKLGVLEHYLKSSIEFTANQ